MVDAVRLQKFRQSLGFDAPDGMPAPSHTGVDPDRLKKFRQDLGFDNPDPEPSPEPEEVKEPGIIDKAGNYLKSLGDQALEVGDQVNETGNKYRNLLKTKIVEAPDAINESLGLNKPSTNKAMQFGKNLNKGIVDNTVGFGSQVASGVLGLPEEVAGYVKEPKSLLKPLKEAGEMLVKPYDPREYTAEKLYQDPVGRAMLAAQGLGLAGGFKSLKKPSAVPEAVMSETKAAPKSEPTIGEITTLNKDVDLPQAKESSIKDNPLPESPETLAAQMEALQQGRTKAVLVTPGAEIPKTSRKLSTVDTEAGTFIFDPLKISKSKIKRQVANGTHGEILGYLEPKSDTTTQTVVAATPEGIELKTAVASPENVPAQAAEFQKQFPNAKIQTGGEELTQKVLTDRINSNPDLSNVDFGELLKGGFGDETGSLGKISDATKKASEYRKEIYRRVKEEALKMGVDVSAIAQKMGLSQSMFSKLVSEHETKQQEGTLPTGEIKERGFITSVKEGQNTPKELAQGVEGNYGVKTNASTLDFAKQAVAADPDKAAGMVFSTKENTPESNVIAMELIAKNNREGNFNESIRIANHVAKTTTNQAQALQSLSMYAKLGPEGIVKMAAKEIQDQRAKLPEKKAKVLEETTQKVITELKKVNEEVPKKDLPKNFDQQVKIARKAMKTKTFSALLSDALGDETGSVGNLGDLEAGLAKRANARAARQEIIERLDHFIKEKGMQLDEAIKATGIDKETLIKIQQKYNQDLQEKTAEAGAAKKQKIIDSLLKKKISKDSKKIDQKIIELSNAGIFDKEQYRELIAAKMGLPHLTESVAKELVQRATDLQKMPEGPQKNNATAEMLRLVKPASAGDKFWQVWYSNILSGPTTHVKNVLGSTTGIVSELARVGATSPKELPSAISGVYQGLIKGASAAKEVFKYGDTNKFQDTGRIPVKFEGKAKLLNVLDYIGRTLSGTDAFFEGGIRGMEAGGLARDQGVKEGLKGKDLKARSKSLFDEKYESDEAKAFSNRGTYKQDPAGVIGALAEGVSKTTNLAPITRFIAPFTKVVANVVNNSLDWTPLGLMRDRAPGLMTAGQKPFDIKTGRQHYQQLGRAALGTLAMGYFANLAAQDKLTGNGPSDYNKKLQLQATGWKPNSILIGDDYVPYTHFAGPLALPMALVGNYFDAAKYGNVGEKDLLDQTSAAVMGSAKTILDMSFLQGVSELMSSIQNSDRMGASFGKKFIAQQATSLVPNLVKQVARYNDPGQYEADSLTDKIKSNLRITSGLKPALDVWGDRINGERFTQLETSKKGTDPIKNYLIDNKLWISEPSKNTNIYDYKLKAQRELTKDEYYNYIKESGPLIKQYLTQYMPQIQKIPDNQDRQDFINKIVSETRKTIRAKIIEGTK